MSKIGLSRTPATMEIDEERSTVPRFMQILLYAMLTLAGLVSIPRIGEYGLPATMMLDVWIILFAIACLLRGRTQATMLLLFVSGFLLTRIIPAAATTAPLEDFLQAHRWILYLIVFTLAVGRHWGPVEPLVRMTWALLWMALAKSVLTLLIEGPGERAGLLLENNFELALFAGLVVVLYPHIQRRFSIVVVFGVVTIMSGSRSGAIAFLMLALFAILQTRQANLFLKYLLACTIPLMVLVPVWIFSSRMGPGGRIDRLNFLDVFLYETRDWSVLDWLFGTVPITPLSGAGCSRLSFYQELFASTGDGTCYSVILHAFILRVIFDAGIIGLVIGFGITWYTLRRSGVRTTIAVTLLMIAFTNGLSVSGLNNPYVALPILLAILTAGVPSQRVERATPEKSIVGGFGPTAIPNRG
ncbi:hypothetical protein [Salinibacterium sp. ZJ454]|uniref:hypothetical protein n=1 Tax=Salinibacterium sp. ZJ454 TaxID=2708339 RepID=UPI001420F696|nr:hypothetical protein [Salinibacterium sp. ZJ454]